MRCGALQVDGQLVALLHRVLDVRQLVSRHDDGRQAGVDRVLPEDVAERRREHCTEAAILERPGCVLARGAAAEVAPGEQDRRAWASMQLESGILHPVEEEELAVPGALDPLQELLGDDLVRVDVGTVEDGRPSLSPNVAASCELPDVREAPADRSGDGHRGAEQVGAAAGALPSLEVAVRRRRAPLAGLEDVRVHPEAHRAAGAAPFEAGALEHLAEALLLGLALHLRRARHDDRVHAVGDPPARRRPRAAARRSSMRAFVHEPMNTLSMRMSRSGVPGVRSM